jgi:hypothetical protein
VNRDKTIHIGNRDARIVRTRCGLLKDEVYEHSTMPKKVTCITCIEKELCHKDIETIRLLQWQKRLKELQL